MILELIYMMKLFVELGYTLLMAVLGACLNDYFFLSCVYTSQQ